MSSVAYSAISTIEPISDQENISTHRNNKNYTKSQEKSNVRRNNDEQNQNDAINDNDSEHDNDGEDDVDEDYDDDVDDLEIHSLSSLPHPHSSATPSSSYNDNDNDNDNNDKEVMMKNNGLHHLRSLKINKSSHGKKCYNSKISLFGNIWFYLSNPVFISLIIIIFYLLSNDRDQSSIEPRNILSNNSSNLSSFISSSFLPTPSSFSSPLPLPVSPDFDSFLLPPLLPFDLPVLSRTIHLFLCESQVEFDKFAINFPTISGDALLYCWRESCIDKDESKRKELNIEIYSSTWHSHPQLSKYTKNRRLVPFDRKSSILFQSPGKATEGDRVDMWLIQPSLYIINENTLNKGKLTWTQSRNIMLEWLKQKETSQGWKWSYAIFGDGDAHPSCEKVQQETQLFKQSYSIEIINQTIITTTITDTRTSFDSGPEAWLPQYIHSLDILANIQSLSSSFSSVAPNTNSAESICWLAFDSFLLTASPAVATMAGVLQTPIYPSSYASLNYHYDAVTTSLHNEAIDLLLPYCDRFDGYTWWTSQAYLVFRSICVYGHIFQWNHLFLGATDHREYPRNNAPFAPFEENKQQTGELNIYPSCLQQLHDYNTHDIWVAPMTSFKHYTGWYSGMVIQECWTKMDNKTCERK